MLFRSWKATLEGHIEGYATTNNFQFRINDKLCWVAMPQNVLTSHKLRGKGVFQLLYQKTELDNIEQNNVDYFITFTNELSTPIFLKKFGYINGKCPDVLISLFNPFHLFFNVQYKREDSLESLHQDECHSMNNSILKSKEYYQWRYSK